MALRLQCGHAPNAARFRRLNASCRSFVRSLGERASPRLGGEKRKPSARADRLSAGARAGHYTREGRNPPPGLELDPEAIESGSA